MFHITKKSCPSNLKDIISPRYPNLIDRLMNTLSLRMILQEQILST
jgi:hypothetical protein